MSSLELLQSPPHAVPPTKLDTLPPEVRAVIYTHLYDNLCLKVARDGNLCLRKYPWQLSAVSRLLRNEVLPILRGTSQAHPLHLACELGRFPDHVKRRIPNEVLWSINIITIGMHLTFDDIKPSLTTFPNLLEIRLLLSCVFAPKTFARTYHAAKLTSSSSPPVSEDQVRQLIHDVKHGQIMDIAAELKREEERPREGLERDYLVEGTMYQLLNMDRHRRGFNVKMEALLLCGYEETVDPDKWCCGRIRIDDWDSGRGSYFDDRKTEYLDW